MAGLSDFEGMDRGRQTRWWVPSARSEKSEPHAEVFSLFERYRAELDDRITQLRLYELVYSDCPENIGAFGITDSALDAGVGGEWSGEITLNITRSMVSAVTSKLTKNRPLPTVQTTRGSWEDHLKGRDLSQFMEGDFENAELRDATTMAFVDCTIYDAGFVKTFIRRPPGGKPYVVSERVDPQQVMVDPAEAAAGQVWSLFQRVPMDRSTAMRLWPKHAEAIYHAKNTDYAEEDTEQSNLSDLIEVVEAWRRPSAKGAGDGRHVICIDNATLLDEEWEHPWFPFARIRWSIEPNKFYGRSLVSELMPVQAEINRLAAHVQEAFHLGSNFVWKVPRGAQVEEGQIGNRNGQIIYYDGSEREPSREATPVVASDVFNHFDRLWARSFDIAGVSELAVSARKPADLESGKALRTYHDIGSERFARVAQEWEQLHQTIAEQRNAMYRQLRKEGHAQRVQVGGRLWSEEIDFPNLDESKYRLRITPVSAFSATLAGRIAEVQDLIRLQVITDPVEVRRALQLGDPQADTSLEVAIRDLAERVANDILRKGRKAKYLAFDPIWEDAVTFLRVARQHYMLAQQFDPPEEPMTALKQFIESCTVVIAEQQALEAAMMQPAGPGAPMPGPASPAGAPPGGQAMAASPIPPAMAGLPNEVAAA